MASHLLSGRGSLPAICCRSCIPGSFIRFLEAGIFGGSRFLRLRGFFRLSGILMESAVSFLPLFIKAVVFFLRRHAFCILRLHEALPDQL